MKHLTKKGQMLGGGGFTPLLALGLGLVIAGILFAIGMQILGNLRDTSAVCATAGTTVLSYDSSNQSCYNASGGAIGDAGNIKPTNADFNASVQGLEGMGNVSGKFPLIGTVVAAIVVIGLVVAGLGVYFRNR
jgi:hypothetical protein